MKHSSPSRIRYLVQALLFSSLLLSVVSSLFIAMGHAPVSHAATKGVNDTSFYTDTVLVVDNVNLIKTHDPDGYRYTAAQLYVNLAPVGDRVGLVEITSSPTPKKILDLQDMNNTGKTKVNQALNSFGPVDPNPTAYFTPALQAAKSILDAGSDRNNRKYVVIVTDVVALSGDQDQCADSPDQYHKWFCTARDLENQGITVILLGFSAPGSEQALKPTQNYLDAHGGTVLPVADGGDVAQRLAQTYTELLTRTHPNIFLAKFNGTPDTVTIGAEDRLTDMTFVGLGPLGVSLADVQTPTKQHVAGQSSGDGTYSTATGKGYWMETISGGGLVGQWHLQGGATPPNQLFVVGISEGKFELLNPGPAFPNSEVGLRYIAPQEPVILRARVTKADSTPPVGISFIADPGSSNASLFSHNTIPVTSIPDSQEADMSAVLSPSSTDFITVGLGKPLTADGIYLLKIYPVSVRSELANKGIQLNVPSSTLLPFGSGVNISAQGTASDKLQSLAIFAREKANDSVNASWLPAVAKNSASSTNLTASFVPPRGCGTVYDIMALEEVSGRIGDAYYDYLTSDLHSFTANIQQTTTVNVTPSTNPIYIEWWTLPWPWPSQTTLTMKVSTTVCTPQTLNTQVQVQQPKGFVPSAVSISSGSGIFSIPANIGSDHPIQEPPITVSLGSCPAFGWTDRTAILQVTNTSSISGNNKIFPANGWEQTVTCPSTFTNFWRYWGPALLLLFFLSIILVRAFQGAIWPFVPRRHILGEIEVMVEAPSLVAQGNGAAVEPDAVVSVTYDIPRRIPVHSGTWYLERRTSGTDVTYVFETRESALAVLAFSILSNPGIEHVGVAATKHATGDKLPVFHTTGLPVGQEAVICEGEAIAVGNDLIYPHLKLSD